MAVFNFLISVEQKDDWIHVKGFNVIKLVHDIVVSTDNKYNIQHIFEADNNKEFKFQQFFLPEMYYLISRTYKILAKETLKDSRDGGRPASGDAS